MRRVRVILQIKIVCNKQNTQPKIALANNDTKIVQLGLDFKLNTKIGLDTTHPPPTHHNLLGHLKAY